MRVRHRIPSIFSISMVDVLCCALGCMILTWLVTDKKKKAALTTNTILDKQLADRKKELEDLDKQLADRKKDQTQDQKTIAELRQDQKGALKTIAELQDKYAALEKLKRSIDSRLTDRQKELEDLEKRLGKVLKENTALEATVTRKTADAKKEADDLTRRADDLNRKLKAALESIQKLELTAKEVPKLQDELKSFRSKLGTETKLSRDTLAELERRKEELAQAIKRYEALQLSRRTLERALEGKTKDLESALLYKEKLAEAEKTLGLRGKQLVESTLTIGRLEEEKKKLGEETLRVRAAFGRLEEEKKKLRDETVRVRLAAEHRFEGIALTGKRVIFLVDTSGSMDLVDEKTPAPTKWGDVRTAVMRVMRSLPDLEKFQLITFSEEINFALGGQGDWIDYDPKTSADKVGDALRKIKPKGGTNMFKPMEAAFRYRPKGLDTMYLFSDGLPNEGEGLTPEQDKTIKEETQRSNLLGKFIRGKLENDWNRTVRGKERVRINTVGFFFESPDVGAFLWALARENDGGFVGMSKP